MLVIKDRRKLYEQLRIKHPVFIYKKYTYAVINNELEINFFFFLGEKKTFTARHIFILPLNFDKNRLSDSLFRNIIFNMGMIELISYWKAACSPSLIIEAGYLDDHQLHFWKKTYKHGLGEFFYTNGIKPEEDFITISSIGKEKYDSSIAQDDSDDRILVPIGGGKDSVVTLELLSNRRNCVPFIMNPREASNQTVQLAGYSSGEIITSKRFIDSELLELNGTGYLNGHTPFSAMLAFTTVLVAYLYGIKEIALSNESSANEPTIPGTKINHQYSKSLDFEIDFSEYLNKYIVRDINYFSFLRPLNELSITKLFTRFHHHFDSFKSCNVGSKTDSWCGKCPKCLFTFIMLAPFTGLGPLTAIFGKNLFDDSSLIPAVDQLSGVANEKPFECIGTVDEVNAALQYFAGMLKKDNYPVLIDHYLKEVPLKADVGADFSRLLREFGQHNIPDDELVNILKTSMNV